MQREQNAPMEQDADQAETDPRQSSVPSRTTVEQLSTAAKRDEVARVRDLLSDARDRDAEERDQAAAERDAAAAARDEATDERERRAVEAGRLSDDDAAELRALRLAAASDRQRSALERLAAAADREQAAADRKQAAADRGHAGLDELTGVFRRGTGELALTHEIDRSRRSGQSLVMAVIDIDALKAINDSQGHPAGDALLRDVAGAITSTLRSYDVTVRWGGDEFVCTLSEVTLLVASERIAEIQRALAAARPGASFSTGLAELADDDTFETLLARADTALIEAKANRDL